MWPDSNRWPHYWVVNTGDYVTLLYLILPSKKRKVKTVLLRSRVCVNSKGYSEQCLRLNGSRQRDRIIRNFFRPIIFLTGSDSLRILSSGERNSDIRFHRRSPATQRIARSSGRPRLSCCCCCEGGYCCGTCWRHSNPTWLTNKHLIVFGCPFRLNATKNNM